MARLPVKVLAMIAAGAGATAIATTYISEKEGLALTSYQDGAKVWTICRGHTKGVQPNQTATPQECDRLFTSEVGQSLSEIDALVKVPMSEPRRAAIASFCGYNLGLAKCAKTTFIRRLNAGDPDPCDEILKFVYVGGQDCRNPASNCRGIVIRREQEAALCRL
ncbi:MAG: lysozyme [Rhodospirillaceae bacterium]|nr:lysozyme [Rhodospirillales bacterium]